MSHLVINVSAPYYNLGAHKLRDWLINQNQPVEYFDGDPGFLASSADHVYLSIIFSWHAPLAVEIAHHYLDHAQVECGGAGKFGLGKWGVEQTRNPRHSRF